MCGISGIAGYGWSQETLKSMISVLHHRGPDGEGVYINESGSIGLGHNRLSIIDLSSAGDQPMTDSSGTLRLIFNGEIYNYLELKHELSDYNFQSNCDSEVILAAYQKWGTDCLAKFIGMFAFALWDSIEQRLFLARDRFGVKPLYYAHSNGCFLWASEIKALHAAGIPRKPNWKTWSDYLGYGLYEHNESTFWEDISSVAAGSAMTWKNGTFKHWSWYDLAQMNNSPVEQATIAEVKERYLQLMESSVKLRFRSDVPVGFNLSGGLDSSMLLGSVDQIFGSRSDIRAFTFATGDERYDETPWVKQMLSQTNHPHEICFLHCEEIPQLAWEVQQFQDEPFGGIPTLAYSKLFKRAHQLGIKVLLDGQGLDEQWAGYDYYANFLTTAEHTEVLGAVQGSSSSPVRPDCMYPEFRLLGSAMNPLKVFDDPLMNVQYRDARFTKIPRTLRFNDRISMMYSTELREPFLDHRLFELALIQPENRKIRKGIHKWLLRELGRDLLPTSLVEAPKRPVQTPQREWLRGKLSNWVEDCLDLLNSRVGQDLLVMDRVYDHWNRYQTGDSDNSFYIWQWINLALCLEANK